MSRMTKAMVLAGMALSAAAGCVTVPGTGPGPSGSEPAPRRAPSPLVPPAEAPGPWDKDAPPREVEAPVREALSQLSQHPDTSAGAGNGESGSAALPVRAPSPGARENRSAPGARTGEHPSPMPARRPEAPGPARESAGHQPAGGGSGGSGNSHGSGGSGGRGGTHVCELGEAYGRWDPGSRQARICRAAYGK
ncbi:hypothetical protein OHB04_39255 [Streptomyces sp. NBC_01775]|uniref:hypothetical protein n=1 Tax=Streptomyces sp. NBC_01775 TaxID=2975939 RepID=UPI002DD8F9E2|nr:hypothetical protein [Streptomyces sp. NBC_01775]WSB81139.1 hypothetical protein OHB04_39255 [Streptomyces sp. NBC_01775]